MAQVQMKIPPNLSTMHQPQLKTSGPVYSVSGNGMLVGVPVSQPHGAPSMGLGGHAHHHHHHHHHPPLMDHMNIPLGPNHLPGPQPMAVPPMVHDSMSPNGPSCPVTLNHHVPGIPVKMEPPSTLNMANTKEKTPMCLVNELARYNKIQHLYRLTDESGPAHKKVFTVALRLGEEEYVASGPSIKKAQHAAAALALEKTSFKHPPPKAQGQQLRMGDYFYHSPMTNGKGLYNFSLMDGGYCGNNMTPTVELNALAMKRGEPAVYKDLEPPRHPYNIPPNFNFRGMYNQRYHYHQRTPQVFYVSLTVGNREFLGEGRTSQAARHNAAARALRALRDLPLPDHASKAVEENKENGPNLELDPNSDLKSPIGLVHEIALKRNLSVTFEVIRESGPPHLRTFVTKCIVGEMVTEGEGNGKKISKKRAAEKMLEELKALPSLPATVQKVKKKLNTVKKKSRNLIKVSNGTEQKGNPEYSQGINPISRLIQIQQAKKEKEPVYTLIAERGLPRRREFVMQVTVAPHSCMGTGPNKKLAKRAAAESLLQMLGYSRPQPQPSKPAIKTPGQEGAESDKNRKVTFLDQEVTKIGERPETEGRGGRQLVPGLILMPDLAMGDGGRLQGFSHGNTGGPLHQETETVNKVSMQTTATIAKELLAHGISPTAEAILKSGRKSPACGQQVRAKQQLLYLADVLGFTVQFTDFPKGNKTEFLSLISLSTNPPQVSHGAGPTLEASHDEAALTALKDLAAFGIDAVSDDKKENVSMATGDGVHINGGPKLANSNGPDLGGNGKVATTIVTAKPAP